MGLRTRYATTRIWVVEHGIGLLHVNDRTIAHGVGGRSASRIAEVST